MTSALAKLGVGLLATFGKRQAEAVAQTPAGQALLRAKDRAIATQKTADAEGREVNDEERLQNALALWDDLGDDDDDDQLDTPPIGQ